MSSKEGGSTGLIAILLMFLVIFFITVFAISYPQDIEINRYDFHNSKTDESGVIICTTKKANLWHSETTTVCHRML